MTLPQVEINLSYLMPHSRIYWYGGRAYRYDYSMEELQQVERGRLGRWFPVWLRDVDRADWDMPKARRREIRRLDAAIRDAEFSAKFNVVIR